MKNRIVRVVWSILLLGTLVFFVDILITPLPITMTGKVIDKHQDPIVLDTSEITYRSYLTTDQETLLVSNREFNSIDIGERIIYTQYRSIIFQRIHTIKVVSFDDIQDY